VYGGNAGLAFAMCAARKKRKEPAGRAEAFFCLELFTYCSFSVVFMSSLRFGFWLLFGQAKSD
jgi:hypothetical protein